MRGDGTTESRDPENYSHCNNYHPVHGGSAWGSGCCVCPACQLGVHAIKFIVWPTNRTATDHSQGDVPQIHLSGTNDMRPSYAPRSGIINLRADPASHATFRNNYEVVADQLLLPTRDSWFREKSEKHSMISEDNDHCVA